MQKSSTQVLGLFRIVMINVIAVDSIRTLPFSAELGFSLIFFYLISGLLFFIPSALMSAELCSTWPITGGIYIWVREAFGKKWGFFTIWCNWIYNVVWYPTILSLIAGTFTYFFDPSLVNNKIYMVSVVLALFWIATYFNCKGMRVSSFISILGAIIGTLLPMAFIALLGIYWMIQKHPMQIDLSWGSFFPKLNEMNKLAFFGTVLFGLLGLEMAATHAAEMRNPQKDYPKALFISVIIILISIVLSSLAIAIVVPNKEISLVVGVLQAFTIFFKAVHIEWMIPVIAALIILGGISGMSAWIIGPPKGLLMASKDKMLPTFFSKTNKHNVPTRILVGQAIIVSFLCLAYFFMPTVNSSFWLLSNISAELALIVYLALFMAGIKLRYNKSDIERPYKIPFGNKGIWIVGAAGFVISAFAILCGFIPPPNISIGNVWVYESILLLGIAFFCLIPFFLKSSKSVNR